MRNLLQILTIALILSSCTADNSEYSEENNKKEFTAALQMHLNAITNKDIATVVSTLPKPKDNMYLILPDGTTMNTAGDFINMHREWFKDSISNWKLTFNIKNVHTNKDLGFAIVEALLKEPARNGKPYFHKMLVSYVLEKKNKKWLVIKDHASTLEKSK
jgi:ketosteroid isomerase-like protein